MTVLVVGAGIGGLTLALSLHQAGIPCGVFETVAQPRPWASAPRPRRCRYQPPPDNLDRHRPHHRSPVHRPHHRQAPPQGRGHQSSRDKPIGVNLPLQPS